jgi:hypothetical protein
MQLHEKLNLSFKYLDIGFGFSLCFNWILVQMLILSLILIPILPKCRITIWETRIGLTTKCKTNPPTNICLLLCKGFKKCFWNGE